MSTLTTTSVPGNVLAQSNCVAAVSLWGTAFGGAVVNLQVGKGSWLFALCKGG